MFDHDLLSCCEGVCVESSLMFPALFEGDGTTERPTDGEHDRSRVVFGRCWVSPWMHDWARICSLVLVM
jgi:hypothetical protein